MPTLDSVLLSITTRDLRDALDERAYIFWGNLTETQQTSLFECAQNMLSEWATESLGELLGVAIENWGQEPA